MDELLAVLNATQSVAVAVLVWRAYVADGERKTLLDQLALLNGYLREVLLSVLVKTDLHD